MLPEYFGLSTGWSPATRQNFPAAVARAGEFSSTYVELSALSFDDLPLLQEYLVSEKGRKQMNAFPKWSVHAPAKHLPNDWQEMLEDLASLEAPHFVFHPDTVPSSAWEHLRGMGERVVFENLDVRKNGFQTAREITRAFDECPRAGFCLDVAHAWTIDSTLEVAHALVEDFSEQLVQVHLSGITALGEHVITTQEHLNLYQEVLERVQHVPWVFESALSEDAASMLP